ncbi:MAG: SRPBCC family protein [Rhizomicrobium sp.]|jgi:uncharacterized protein YndB with AHSA1/START domain
MSGEFTKYGSLKVMPGATEVRISRDFPQSVDRLWQALVEPDQLVDWLAPGSIEPHEGGTAKLDFSDSGIVIDSTVSEFDAPRSVAYSWSGPGEPTRPLRFETMPIAEGTRLTMTLQLPAGEDAARAAAGFEAHLEMLAAALEGVPIKFPLAMFKAMQVAYRAA